MKLSKIKREKRGISPIVATILLIAVAVAAFVFIFAWMRGFVKESVEKLGEPAENACQSMAFTANLAEDKQTIFINNQGNIPIYGFNVEKEVQGSTFMKFVRPADGNINAGESDSLSIDLSGAEKVRAVPVLLGTGKSSGKGKLFPCEDKKFELS